jgi:hypothetical protein
MKQGAIVDGRHIVVRDLARSWFQATEQGTAKPCSPLRFRWIRRRHPSPGSARPVGFLTSFTARGAQYVVPLKIGVNRVGRDPVFGDFDGFPSRPRLVEGRQWLIICTADRTLIADDHSTNQSLVLRRTTRLVSGPDDPRFGADRYSYVEFLRCTTEAERVTLDWAGDVVVALEDGDALLNAYAGFVFGRLGS